ncbi:ATP-binding cassette domain-containing protein [Streptomyces olivaceiscleroticus]|uniref:ATP-binding cassette domain-containing protein n=1 Tax=Streptomyces olivaceiscleroticus TaxID=68245 RepID=UPI003D158F4C
MTGTNGSDSGVRGKARRTDGEERLRDGARRFLGRRRAVVARLAAWSVAEAAQTFLLGFALARAVDDGFLAGRPTVGLGWLAAAALAVAVGSYGTGRVYRSVADLVEPLRDELLRRVVTRALREADHGAVSRAAHQVEIARDTFGGLVMVVRGFVFTAAGALIGLLSLAPVLLLVVLPPLVLGLGLHAVTLRPVTRGQETYLAADEAIVHSVGVAVGGLRDVTAGGAEERVAREVGERFDAEWRASRTLARWHVCRHLALGVGGRLPVVLLLVTAPWLLGNGATPGALVGALAYLTQSLLPALHALLQGLGTSGTRLAVVLRRLTGAGRSAAAPDPAAPATSGQPAAGPAGVMEMTEATAAPEAADALPAPRPPGPVGPGLPVVARPALPSGTGAQSWFALPPVPELPALPPVPGAGTQGVPAPGATASGFPGQGAPGAPARPPVPPMAVPPATPQPPAGPAPAARPSAAPPATAQPLVGSPPTSQLPPGLAPIPRPLSNPTPPAQPPATRPAESSVAPATRGGARHAKRPRHALPAKRRMLPGGIPVPGRTAGNRTARPAAELSGGGAPALPGGGMTRHARGEATGYPGSEASGYAAYSAPEEFAAQHSRAATDTPVPLPAWATPPAASGLAVEARGVSFAYGEHATPVVQGLELTLPVGGHLAVVGPSGIGKSTLAALLAGVLVPDRGEIRLGGNGAGSRRVLVPQQAYVFSGTLRENLLYLCPRPESVPDAALRASAVAVGAAELVQRLGGFGARVTPGTLSAGERQLIALARAHLAPAPLALLDEAGCHLDAATEARAERAFAARPGGSLIVVAHRISSALRADRVLVMDGTYALCGRHRDLLRRSALYRDLVGEWADGGARPALAR